jgi:hypothetical protein
MLYPTVGFQIQEIGNTNKNGAQGYLSQGQFIREGKGGRLKLNNNQNFNHFLFHADFHWTGIYFLNLGQS